MESTSGRSSRSTFTLTNRRFISPATSASSKHSCAMTWHQWHAEEPTLNRIGTLRSAAAANASGPQGYQSTGLSLCCRRYGLVSWASRLLAFMTSRYRQTGERFPRVGSVTYMEGNDLPGHGDEGGEAPCYAHLFEDLD